MTDIERQLVTAMGDCPNCAGTGIGQGKEYYTGCKNCNKTGKRPVLLGVVVERCAKGVHQYKTKEHRLALFGEDLDCACLDHCGYVLAWDIGKALEWLRTKYPNVRLSSFEYYPPEKPWHVKCQPSFDALLYTGFEVEAGGAPVEREDRMKITTNMPQTLRRCGAAIFGANKTPLRVSVTPW